MEYNGDCIAITIVHVINNYRILCSVVMWSALQACYGINNYRDACSVVYYVVGVR